MLGFSLFKADLLFPSEASELPGQLVDDRCPSLTLGGEGEEGERERERKEREIGYKDSFKLPALRAWGACPGASPGFEK